MHHGVPESHELSFIRSGEAPQRLGTYSARPPMQLPYQRLHRAIPALLLSSAAPLSEVKEP